MKSLRPKGTGTSLSVRVQPGASKSEVVGPYGDEIKIRIHAPPVDGKANEALVEFLSDVLEIPAKRVVIVSGESSRSKIVEIHDLKPEFVSKKLGLS